MLIQFQPDTNIEERYRVIRSFNAELIEWIEPLHMAHVTLSPQITNRMTANVGTSEQSIQAGSALLSFVEPDGRVEGTYLPNDPAIKDTHKSYAYNLIQMPTAWDLERGHQRVLVAILDTGIDIHHVEFGNRIVQGYDFANGDTDPSDDHGHGTHVAGVVAAEMDNGHGSVGVCPRCRILPIKVLNRSNRGTWSAIIKGIIFAVDNGAQIINLSLGGATPSKSVEAAIRYAQEHDVLVVAAVGNSKSSTPFYPAAYDGVISVSASTKEDNAWPMSNYGSYIDVAAPGHMIYSTFNGDSASGNNYAYMSGTSMAAPYVAGLAGLLLSQNSKRTPSEVITLIQQSAVDLGAPGWDPIFGHGRINAYGALLLEQNDVSRYTPEWTTAIYLPIFAIK
ncbi:S8 family peptidase [Chloroflexi bacterium TSY]|nr:S8 family peptidase [Chloroflexi bacterium TSY]